MDSIDGSAGNARNWNEESSNGDNSYEVNLEQLTQARDKIEQDHYSLHWYIRIAESYLRLGYPDLTVGAAYKALLLSDSIQDESDEYHEAALKSFTDFVTCRSPHDSYHSHRAPDNSHPEKERTIKMTTSAVEQCLSEIYCLLIVALSSCGCYRVAANYYSQASIICPNDASLQDAHDELYSAVAKHFKVTIEELRQGKRGDPSTWPEQGFARREVYPWNDHEPKRLETLTELNDMMSAVAPKLEVKVVRLPSLTLENDGNSGAFVEQLGVFAKENLTADEIILDEVSLLTANNKLQDALCDACSADLPDLSSTAAESIISCPDCEVVFCSQQCYDSGMDSYHPSLCGMEVEAIAKETPATEAAESLYSLLLLRALAMAQTQDCHPLDLKEVKYIWGDFNDLPAADSWHTTDDGQQSSDVAKTLPFSFRYNVQLPFHMLEKMDIDIFAHPQYDTWVFNTLYAKFRGTASARLSGSRGGAMRGPEVGAVHPMWCLANHSCDPNVSWEWGGSIKFWIRDSRKIWERGNEKMYWNAAGIKKGEEVLNHYCDVDLPVNERREWMRGCLGGDCRCERCSWEAGES